MSAIDIGAHRVVVVGGGFAGFQAVRGLRRASVEVTLVDRHTLFQPQVYQVATGALSPAGIAMPLRKVFRRQRNVRVLLGEVTAFDLVRREIVVDRLPNRSGSTRLGYDTLIVAAGSSYSHFDHDEWGPLAPDIKLVENALDVRRRVLTAFEEAYGSNKLGASALFPFVGFLPASDERVRETVAAIERHLGREGLLYRYTTSDVADAVDALPADEGAFLTCSVWLAGNYARSGRVQEARALFERLLSLRNDVGLLAEDYDAAAGRQIGNISQAFSHVPLGMVAFVLDETATTGLV